MLALLLFLAAAPPEKPSPSPTPSAPALGRAGTATDGRARTLSELARELKEAKEKGAAPRTGGSVTEAKPGVIVSGARVETTVPTSVQEPRLTLDGVDHNDQVGPTGLTTVFGKVHNSGGVAACGIKVGVRLNDEQGAYLSSSEASLDQSQVLPGETVSFNLSIQVPPGIAGRQRDRSHSQSRGTTIAGGTMDGNWKYLGRVDAEIRASRACGPPPAEPKPEPTPSPSPTPVPTPDGTPRPGERA